MQKSKKALSVLLSILMVLTLIPWAIVPAFAEDPAPTYTWTYDDDTDTLTFTGTGALPDYTMYGENGPRQPDSPWAAYCETAEKIVIGENITRVGAYDFFAFDHVTEVVLPSTLTSIGAGAFAYCIELAEIDLPAGLTELGATAFGANSLTSVNVPAGVRTLDNVFSYNFAPLEVTLNEGLETVKDSFSYTVVENLTIPSSVTLFQGYMNENTEESSHILNVKTLVNNSADAAVSDHLASVKEEGLSVYLLMSKMEMRMSLLYLRTGDEPGEETLYPLYLEFYNAILDTDYTDFNQMMADFESGNISPELQEKMDRIEDSINVVNAPLPSVQIFCLSESAEHDALRANGYPHYLIDQDNALCTEPVVLQCGDNMTWEIDNDTQTLVITGYGEMYDDYTGWLFYRDAVNNIRFEESGGAITKIGSYAFANFGALETVAVPAGITYFGYDWLEYCDVGTLVLPAGFSYWEESPNSEVFSSYADSIGAFSVEQGNPVYFTVNGSLYGNQYGQVWLVRYGGSGDIFAGTDVIRGYAFYRSDITDVTIPGGVSRVEYYAFSNSRSLETVNIAEGSGAMELSLNAFCYCNSLSAFAVSENDTRFAVENGVLYNKNKTKVVAVPFTVSELTLSATVTGVYVQNGNTAYAGENVGLTKLTVLDPDFDFGYSYNGSTSAFCMKNVRDPSTLEVCGNTNSTAETFAMRSGYTFTPLNDVTIESVVFDLSRVPQRVVVGSSESFQNWSVTGVVTYSDGSTRSLSYGNGDFKIYYKYPNSTSWHENNWIPFEYGTGDYLFEIRYGTFVTSFTITAAVPDYHYEFDTSAAVTEVKQYGSSSDYASHEEGNYNILGVKLYKVYDDPAQGREQVDFNGSVNVYVELDGETWHWSQILYQSVGETYTVYFRADLEGMQAEAQISVTVIPGDYTITLTGMPETVPQFSSFTNENCGVTATLTTVSGNTYDVSDRFVFSSYDVNNADTYNFVNTTVPGEYSIRAGVNVYSYYHDDALGDIYVSYFNFDPFTVTVVPAPGFDHFRLEVPAQVEAEIGYNIPLTDYVKAYAVYADETEEELTDLSGVRFEGRVQGGTYTGSYLYLHQYGERVSYTVTLGDATASMLVIAVQNIVCDLQYTVTTFDAWPGRYLYAGDFGLTVTRTKDGVTADITDDVWFSGTYDTYWRDPGTYTVQVWYSDPDLHASRMAGEITWTLVNETSFALRDVPEAITITQGDDYSLADARIVKVRNGVETDADSVAFWIRSQDGVGYGTRFSDLPVGTYEIVFYGGIYENGESCSINYDMIEGNAVPLTVECAAHQPQLVAAAVPATCYDPGHIAYWQCAVCGRYFSDEACTAGITLDEIEVPAIAHANAEHTAAVPATCYDSGNMEYWYCPDCETYFADADFTQNIALEDTVIPAIAHENAEYHEANDPTCTADGNIEYWYCPDCETYFADAEFTDEIGVDDTVIPGGHVLEPHEGAQATCTEDGNLPYNECTRCHKLFADAEATQEITDPEEIVLKAHHTLTRVAAVPNTCTEAGNIEYWTCSACGEWFSDENGTAKIEDHASVTLNAKNHSWGAWTKLDDTQHQRVCGNDVSHKETAPHTWDNGRVTQNPTCTGKGTKTYTCTVCGATRSEELAAAGHKDANSDGVCDVCSANLNPTQPTEPESNCVCGQYHTGPFAWLIKFIHRITYFFKNLFNR